MKEKMKNIYDKLCNIFTIKNITIITFVFFAVILLPLLACSFVNRASGDDYGYGEATRAAWIASHSLIAVFKAAWSTIKQFYYSWQGTWFSIFLFTLQPEVFNKDAYVIVVFLMLFLLICSSWLLFYELLNRKFGFDKWSTTLIITLFLIITISFIPRTKSGIFWFNGCAHYMVPFTMCQFVFYWLLKYGEKYQIRYFVGIAIFMTLLGGANYQAALLSLIVAVYFIGADFCVKRQKKMLALLIPCVSEGIGLIISMKSPGNSIRGGEEFGFSIGKVTETVGLSFVYGIKDVIGYFQTKPMVFVGLFLIFLVALEAMRKRKEESEIRYPSIIALSVYCLYSAMQAPAIYARVDVSGGVYNTNYQMFLIMSVELIILLAYQINKVLKSKAYMLWTDLYKKIIMPGFLIGIMLMVVCRSDIKESTTWICIDYIKSGQAKDYKYQMDQLTELMLDETKEDIVVPYINDYQGPLMHMPVTDNPDAWTNWVICQYYDKNSVIAIPRSEWEGKYQ